MTDGFDLSDLSTQGTAMADDLGVSGKAQGVKVVIGTDGTNDGYVWSGNPFPVILKAGADSIGNVGVTALVPGVSATQLGKQVDNAAGASDTGIAILGVRTTTPGTITPANGDYAPFRLDDQGNLRVNITAGAATAQIDDSAFTPGVSEVVVVGFVADETSTDSIDEGEQGAGRMTLDRKQIVAQYAHTAGGWLPHSRLSVGTTEDETVVKASPGQVGWLMVTNTNASARYIKFYDSTNPTPGTTTPVLRFLIPGNTDGFTINFGPGVEFLTGISYALLTGVADSDVAEVAANEIIVNLGYR
jgi:hypothetical protein